MNPVRVISIADLRFAINSRKSHKMDTIELRKNFHLLIDNIENEALLNNFYDLMKSRYSAKDFQLWNKLTTQDQEELLLTLEESNNPDYLINQDEMKKKHKKWL